MKLLTCPFCGRPETIAVDDDVLELDLGETELADEQTHLEKRVLVLDEETHVWAAGGMCVQYLADRLEALEAKLP